MKRLLRYLLRVTAPQRDGLALWDLIEIGLVALGFLAYFLVRGAVVDRSAEAFSNARSIIALQEAVGLWIEPQFQVWALRSELLIRVMNFVYFWLDFPLLVAIGLVFFWRRRACYTLLRDAVLISGAIALVFYWTYPVAPPRYLVEFGFVDTMERYSNLSYQAQSMRPFVNPFAALPSLHVGWAAIVAYTLFRATQSRLVRAAGVVIFFAQGVAVIVTANHYLFDGVIGLVVCGVALGLAIVLQRRGYPGMRALIAWLERRAARGRPAREA
ncbi:MAG: phosphatase PAP2 family protein [Dehalococcoidia bacterium]